MTEVWARASPFPALNNADWKSSLELCAPNPDLGREQVPLLEATARRLLSAIEAALEPLEGKRIDGPIRGVIVEAQHQTWEALGATSSLSTSTGSDANAACSPFATAATSYSMSTATNCRSSA